MMNSGLIWITGMSGSGKSTIAKLLYQRLSKKNPSIVHLDGDQMREVFGKRYGYTYEDRRELAGCYARLCKLLSSQGMLVICSTVALLHEVHEYNRANNENYLEVYLDVPKEILMKRDQKNLYSNSVKGLQTDVVGLDIKTEFPINPDLRLSNHGKTSARDSVKKITDKLKEL